MKLLLTIASTALFTALATPSAAEPSSPLELTGFVELERAVTDETGERRVERVEPKVVVPGDRLIFGTRFANIGTQPIERFVVSNPVPASVSVTPDIDPDVLVSVDGGKSWGRLGELEVVDADGNRRAAQASEITNVRWVLAAIASGETGQLEFPVTVR
jgi:uncharacterized repeat protein (TIGR01451 family)